MKPIKTISTIAAILVTVLATLAFVLSYSSLQHLADTNGVGPRLSYLWPLLLDFAMIVFSLAILRANLRQESAYYPWALTIVFASLATIANVLDVVTLGIPGAVIAAAVKALAPVALVLSFELLMSMIRAEIRRADVIASVGELRQERESLNEELVWISKQVEKLTAKRESIQADVSAMRKEKRAFTAISDDTKAEAEAILAERSGISGAELGRLLGKSESLGRKLKREISESIQANGSGVTQ